MQSKPLKKARKSNVEEKQPTTYSEHDPVLCESVVKRLVTRNMCSIKVSELPKRYTYADLVELSPEMCACRIPHDSVSRKPKRFAFIEFSSEDLASECLRCLRSKEYKGKTLQVSAGGGLSENIGKCYRLFCNCFA